MNHQYKFSTWLIILIVIIIIIGTFLHFSYDLSNQNKLVGAVSSVNESVWEHLKLIIFPVIIAVTVFSVYKGGNNPYPATMGAMVIGMLFIIVTFYTYTGAFTGQSQFIIDIITFIIAAIISALVILGTMRRKQYSNNIQNISMIVVIVIVAMFVVFTYNPPSLPLFEEILES